MEKNSSLIFIFSLQVLIFTVVVFLMFVARSGTPFLMTLGGTFSILGAILIILALRSKITGWLRKFLLLTGISSAGFFTSVILHNFVYGLFMALFGDNFWESIGLPDEPVFFILAIIVCPIAFIIGVAGTIFFFIKERKSIKKENN